MFTYSNVLKWIPAAKPRKYNYCTWDRRSQHCVELQKYHHELENLVALTSSLKEVEDAVERKEILDSLPPIPDLPEMNNDSFMSDILDEVELSEDSILSLLSKAAARICLLVGYTDAPQHLLEELSKIVKDFLKLLILKCSVAEGPITLNTFSDALQELGINGVEELQCYYFFRIIKFHNSLYSKCEQLRNELESNMKLPLECPSTKHLCKRKKCKYRNVELKEENVDNLNIESGETIEVLFIRKLMKSNNFVKKEDKSDIKKIKCDVDIPVTDQKLCENDLNSCAINTDIPATVQNPPDIDSKSCLNAKEETSSNYESCKYGESYQNSEKKEEFEESDKKLLDKYAAFLSFVPMKRKSKLIDKPDLDSKQEIHQDQLKKDLSLDIDNTRNCNSLVTKEYKFVPESKADPTEKIFSEKLSNLPNSAVSVKSPPSFGKSKSYVSKKCHEIVHNTSDTKVLSESIISNLDEIAPHTLTHSVKSDDEKDLIPDDMDKKIDDYSVTFTTYNIDINGKDNSQNLKPNILQKKQVKVCSSNLKKKYNTRNKSCYEKEEIKMSEEIKDEIELKYNEYNEQNTELEKDISLSNLHKSCFSDNKNEGSFLNTKSKEMKTLKYLSIDNSSNHSMIENTNEYLNSEQKRKKPKLKNDVSDVEDQFKKTFKLDSNSIKDFNVLNSELNKISCCQSAIKPEKDLLLNPNDFNCSKNLMDSETYCNVSGSKTITCSEKVLDQSSHSTNDLNCNAKCRPVRKRRKLRKK